MKLGNGSIKYKIKFVYELTNRVSYKYVYADSDEQALELFNKQYKNIDARIIDIFDVLYL